jgi:hypothetical protein
MSNPQGTVDAERRPYELAVERYLVDRLTALLRDPPRLSEQEIRARALDVAGRKFGSFGYDVEELLDTSDRLVAYIRDGVRVSAEERTDDTTDLGGSE